MGRLLCVWRGRYGLCNCQGPFLEFALSICFASAVECKALAMAATEEVTAQAASFDGKIGNMYVYLYLYLYLSKEV